MSLYFTKQTTSSYLYVISGFFEEALPSVERLNLETLVWQQMGGKLNIPRTKFAAVQVIDSTKNFIVLGGKNSQSVRTNTIEVYDCKNDVWTVSENLKMPRAKSGFACVSVPQPSNVLQSLFY